MAKKYAATISALCFLLLGFSAVIADAKITIKCQNSLPDSYIASQALVKFAEEVKKETNGEVEIVIYATGQLFKATDLQTAVPTGAIDAALPNLGMWAGAVPSLSSMMFVGIFDSADHFNRALKGPLGDWWAKDLEAKANTKVVSWLSMGNADIITSPKIKLKQASDFKGLKFQCATKGMQIYAEALGAVPTMLDGPEVMVALQRGVVDVAATAANSVLSRKWVDVSKIQTRLMMIPEVPFPIVFNLDAWKSIPEKFQKIILKAGENARAWNMPQVAQQNEDSWAALSKIDGVEILVVPPEEARKWSELAKPKTRASLEQVLGKENSDRTFKYIEEGR